MPARATNGSARTGVGAERQCTRCLQLYRPYAPEQRLCRACFRERRDAWRDGRRRATRRADGLHRRLLASGARTLADVYELRAPGAVLHGWRRRDIDAALDYLVAEGKIEEEAHGQLVVRQP